MNTIKRGFAAMDKDEQKRIASLGGRTAHSNGVARCFTSEEARAAAKKGHEMRKARKQLETATRT